MKRSTLALATGLGLLSLATSALAADGHIHHLEEVGASDRPLVIAASDRGVVFIGADNAVYRAFAHEQDAPSGIDQTFLWIENIDSDGGMEFVGAGNPSFVIDDNGDPLFGITSGCHQFFLGDFIDDSRPEIFCRQERSVTVRSYDGQEYYEWEGRGQNMTTCYQDDYDIDGKPEIACDLTNGNHLLFDLAFDEPEQREGTAEAPLERSGVDPAEGLAYANGEQSLRWGSHNVTLSFAGGSLTIQENGAPLYTVQLGGSGIYSATVADLDRNGAEELYVGGSDNVYVIAQNGTLAATIPANPASMHRTAVVEIRAATANNLENSDRDVVRGQVEAGIGAVQSCYDRALGSDPFTRVGTMLWELEIDDDGNVDDTTRRHSDLRNSDLDSCVGDALEDMEFSAATGDNGIVNLTLRFGFTDAP